MIGGFPAFLVSQKRRVAMISKIILRTFSAVLLVSLSACNLPLGPGLGNGGGGDPTSAAQTQISALVAATSAAQTQVSAIVAATNAAQTNLAIIVQSTLDAMATSTPEFTFTPSFTPTPTFTLTPSAPLVSVSVQTNCRSGPGTAYESIGILNVGVLAQVVGRNAQSDYWIIKLGSSPVITCWLWGQYATLSGDTSALPVIVPPPTPTSAASPTPVGNFSFAYDSYGVGPGYACMMFSATSAGLTWDSYKFTLTDIPQAVTGETTSNDFTDYNSWCIASGGATDIPPGDTGTVMVKLALGAGPIGDDFSATLKLCTEDGLTGTCLTHTLNAVFGP
jgi:hypothetical protein